MRLENSVNKKMALTDYMRTHVVDGGPNLGSIIEINQEFLFRGTDYTSFQEHVEDGNYWGSNDKNFGLSTLVAMNIDGASRYCGRNKPVLLAIAHEKYPLRSPEAAEGFIIPGKISLDDIVIVKTDKDLLNVLPPLNNLGAITIQEIKRRAGIVDNTLISQS